MDLRDTLELSSARLQAIKTYKCSLRVGAAGPGIPHQVRFLALVFDPRWDLAIDIGPSGVRPWTVKTNANIESGSRIDAEGD